MHEQPQLSKETEAFPWEMCNVIMTKLNHEMKCLVKENGSKGRGPSKESNKCVNWLQGFSLVLTLIVFRSMYYKFLSVKCVYFKAFPPGIYVFEFTEIRTESLEAKVWICTSIVITGSLPELVI